jgi:hypothetical protein
MPRPHTLPSIMRLSIQHCGRICRPSGALEMCQLKLRSSLHGLTMSANPLSMFREVQSERRKARRPRHRNTPLLTLDGLVPQVPPYVASGPVSGAEFGIETERAPYYSAGQID